MFTDERSRNTSRDVKNARKKKKKGGKRTLGKDNRNRGCNQVMETSEARTAGLEESRDKIALS